VQIHPCNGFEAESTLIELADILSPVMLAEAMVAKKNRWVSVFLNHVRTLVFGVNVMLTIIRTIITCSFTL
jgi:hypothetical protein